MQKWMALGCKNERFVEWRSVTGGGTFTAEVVSAAIFNVRHPTPPGLGKGEKRSFRRYRTLQFRAQTERMFGRKVLDACVIERARNQMDALQASALWNPSNAVKRS